MTSTANITTTNEDTLSVDIYLSGLLQQCQQRSPRVNDEIAHMVGDRRQQAAAHVLQAKFPTTREESWRFTDLSALKQHTFQLGQAHDPAQAQGVELSSVIEGRLLSETQQQRLTLVNGCFEPAWSDLSGLPEGVYVGPISGLSFIKYGLLTHYLDQPTDDWNSLAWLNSADLHEVTVVWINANTVVEQPIEVLALNSAKATPTFSQPRLLVVVEIGASLTLIESYDSLSVNEVQATVQPHFTNVVSEIYLQVNAQLTHCRVQQQDQQDFHIGTTAIAQARDSRYTLHEVSLGSQLYRHDLQVSQTGEQTETRLNGLVIAQGRQTADTHSCVNLAHPQGSVNQLHKCIIGDHARAVFNGRVFVPQAAQMTNAAQLNRNLLLSPQARVNTKPELQITADNVKCTHGATIAQLEAEELFYLRSRGLSEMASQHLLIDAFATEMIDRLPLASLQAQISAQVAQLTLNSPESNAEDVSS